MLKLKNIIPVLILASLAFNSCTLLLVDADKGKHKGWYKNTNNPHNPHTTNPGHKKKAKKEKGKK